MTEKTLPTRRLFLQRGALSVVALTVVACGDKAVVCKKDTGLTEQEEQARKALGYIDKGTDKTKACDACAQYVAANDKGECGGCKIVAGSIHPQGTCNAFTPA